MPEITALAGGYVGRARIREGMEECLAPVEKKRFQKNNEEIPLELQIDGAFLYKRCISGNFELEGERVIFQPHAFNGQTRVEMEAAAEEMGRAFGLGWLFNAFELAIVGAVLVTPDLKSVIYTEYTRVE